MGIIQSRFEEGLARIEYGVYFASDEVIELLGWPDAGYRAESRAPVLPLLRAAPDGWADLIDGCRAEAGDFVAIGGGTSWEGDGFVALVRRESEALVWLLHLETSEEFVSVEIDVEGSEIRAVSGGYPDRFAWRIPIERPESLTVVRIPAA